jgi:hypothetical protein
VQYHYTDRLNGAEILQAQRIRATKMTLYKDPNGRFSGAHGFETPPIVWLTINPVMEMSVYFKLTGVGRWPEGLVNDIWRFCFPDEYEPLGLAEFATAHRIDFGWFDWTVRTGHLVGSDYTCWRLRRRHIPASDWTAVEVLTGYRGKGDPIWTPRPL